MTDLTEDQLNRLAERHPQGEIYEIIMHLKSLIERSDGETDLTRREALEAEIGSLAILLEREVFESDRGGEDFINDDRFLTR